jgi:hypothetical protein
MIVGAFDLGGDQEWLRLLTEHLLMTIGMWALMMAQGGT